jgi:Zn-dependent peptidase ImmA (M78 family)
VDSFYRGIDITAEILCDKVAAEFLVSADSFRSEWRDDASPASELQRLAARYRVSAIVVLRRALELGAIGMDEFIGLLGEARGYRSEHDEKDENDGKSGGSFLNNFGARNGELFPAAVLGALRGGRILYREAARLLDVRPSTVRELELGASARAG